jgi:hypothetical protein
MEAAEPWDCCDLTDCLRRSPEWSILIECKVRSYAVVICLVIGELMANMPLPQRHDMIEALASDRSDQPFTMTVLPRRAWEIGRLPMIVEQGRLAWEASTGYGQRSLVQTTMGRYKTLIGPRLRARGFAAQQTEAAIGMAVLNWMSVAGRPDSVRRLPVTA